MADSKRCVWERLQMVEAEPFGREGSVTMMLIAWVSVCGQRSVSVQTRWIEIMYPKGKGGKRYSAANSTGFWENLLCGAWYLKSTCKSLLERAFYVRIDQSLFTPIDADLVKCSPHSALYRDSTLSLHCTFYSFVLSSSLPSAENVIAFTVTCHFLFISRDDKALTFGIHRHTHTHTHVGIFNRSFFFPAVER